MKDTALLHAVGLHAFQYLIQWLPFLIEMKPSKQRQHSTLSSSDFLVAQFAKQIFSIPANWKHECSIFSLELKIAFHV